jgi:hypothetical protein
MEPPKPDLLRRYNAAPNVSIDEIHEYERLLAQRFQTDPDLPRDPAAQADLDDRERKIKELHTRIFGASQNLPP